MNNHGVLLGSSRDLIEQLEPWSVDMILTDPVYDQVDDYRWLANVGQRYLKDGASLLAFFSPKYGCEIREAMSQYLTFVWQLNYVIRAKTQRLIAYNLFTWNTPVMWFAKGRGKALDRIPDTFIQDNSPAQGGHRWNKNVPVLEYWINAFTRPGDLVLDPFCGGGSTLVAAKQAGRAWLGFERDGASAALAAERVAAASERMFVANPGKQYELWGAT